MAHPLKFAGLDRYVRTKDDRDWLDRYGRAALDLTRGDRVCRFVERYLIPTLGPGADKPVELLDWQRHEYFLPVFSWVNPESGFRRFREIILSVSRQNGKSLCGAGTCLYMGVADNEPGPSVVIAACVQKQAKDTLFSEVLNSCRHPDFADVLVLRESLNEIEYPARNGKIKAVSTKNSKGGGLGKAHHCYALDEFAFWPDYSLYTAYRTAINKGTRRQPLLITLSSSGWDRSTPAYERVQYGRAILDGSLSDPAFYPLLYETDPVADPIDSPVTWKKANPSIGFSVSAEGMAREAEQAKRSKIVELEYRQFSLGQWVTGGRQFLNLDNWAKCKGPVGEPVGPVFCTLDLSTSNDLTSVGWLWRNGDKIHFDYKAFCCRAGFKRRNITNIIKYEVFRQEGRLEIHEGDGVDLPAVRDFVRSLWRRYRVRSVAVDPKHNALDTMLIFQKEGLPVEQYGSGALYFDTPLRRLSELVDGNRFVHPGDSLINWQAMNLETKMTPDGAYTTDKKDFEKKIDVMTTLLMGLGKLIVSEATYSKPVIQKW